MNYPTFQDMEQKLKNDLDLNEETFVTDTEMKGYFNEAIEMIQHQIHTLAEDYMLSRTPIAVTEGQTELQLPTNIWANKIRKLFWTYPGASTPQNAIERYEILPIRNLQDTQFVDTQDAYQYILLNNGVTNTNTIGTVVEVYPAFRVTDATALSCFFIRNANRYVDENSVCDIPEFSNVIIQYVRYKCTNKEGHPNAMNEKNDLDTLIKNMIEALRSRTMDENTKLSLDSRTLSEYSDFSNQAWNYWY